MGLHGVLDGIGLRGKSGLKIAACLTILFSGCAISGYRHEAAAYGPFARNRLDFWQAETSAPSPVLVCFHGGGFMLGSKSEFRWQEFTRHCLENGISVVAADYRLVRGSEGAPFPAPMLDGARVVQFLRSKAYEWQLDPGRIALYGSSAGANLSLWIAFHEDLAQPDSPDPVARQSSRVAGVIAVDAQTSNDPFWVLDRVGGPTDVEELVFPFYGVHSWDELRTPKLKELAREASPITHVSADDPPVLLLYVRDLSAMPLPRDAKLNDALHSPRFGVELQRRMAACGVGCDVYHAGKLPPAGIKLDYLKRRFGMLP